MYRLDRDLCLPKRIIEKMINVQPVWDVDVFVVVGEEDEERRELGLVGMGL